ncbi:MAG: hypothetical protein K2M75_07895 [Clostridia bacterium]|nr:hypothetical protein [Clostridia bacterium]
MAPEKCPICGEEPGWKRIDEQKKGFSAGKALAGGILLGPIGLVGGLFGKKKALYICTKCGFQHEYSD